MKSYIKKILSRFKERFPTLYQFAAFSAVGTTALAIMLIAYYLCIWMGLSKQIANLTGFLLSTAFSYLLNFVFVFDAKGHAKQGSAVKFFALYLALYFFTAFLIYLFVDVLHVSELLAPIINAIIISPPSFYGSKYWVFRDRNKPKKKPS